MNSQPLSKLAFFGVAKFRFTATAITRIDLPPYQGSALHGGFGHALKKISPTFYAYFYGPSAERELPKPFVLAPPTEERGGYAPGEVWQFDLTLFGTAIQHFPLCFAAFDYLGQQLGFGHGRPYAAKSGMSESGFGHGRPYAAKSGMSESGFGCSQANDRGRYQIDKVEYLDAAGEPQAYYENYVWRNAPAAISGDHIAQGRSRTSVCFATQGLPVQGRPTPDTNTLTLTLQTRLRLKHNGHLVCEPPPFRLLLDRLLGRLHTLSTFYQERPLIPRQEHNTLLAAAAAIDIDNADTHWDDWSRYSGRQKEWMQFGGLLGPITYRGDLTPFVPYLALGEWVHLGGKTSFGLGRYGIELVNEKG